MATIRIYTDDGRLVASYMDGNPEEAPIGSAAAFPSDFGEALGTARADEGRDVETGERSAPKLRGDQRARERGERAS